MVGRLISSPGGYPRAYICDECIGICNSILNEDVDGEPAKPESEALRLRAYLAHLLEYIPDSDLATVEKILHALRDPELRMAKRNAGEVVPISAGGDPQDRGM